MNQYHEHEAADNEGNILSDQQCRSLQSTQAPNTLKAKIQQRVEAMHPAVALRHYALPKMAAAGLLGFLSFLGAQALVGKVIPTGNPDSSAPSVATGSDVTNYHLQGVALMSTSDLYLDTLDPAGSTPEVVLATYMHERGAK